MSALQIEGLSKSFGEFQALKNVSLSVAPGERRAIIGPNGAGKSTLFNMIGGQAVPSAGRVKLDGVNVTGLPPHAMWGKGLTRTFQKNQLFGGLSVLQNLQLASQMRQGVGARLFSGGGRDAIIAADIADLLQQVHLGHRQHALARDLAYGEQRQVELALALIGNPRILLLDEPTAGMSPGETEAMIALLCALPRRVTLLIVEHDMDVVFALADSATVLHLGEVLAEGTPHQIQADHRVMDVYLGRETAPHA